MLLVLSRLSLSEPELWEVGEVTRYSRATLLMGGGIGCEVGRNTIVAFSGKLQVVGSA